MVEQPEQVENQSVPIFAVRQKRHVSLGSRQMRRNIWLNHAVALVPHPPNAWIRKQKKSLCFVLNSKSTKQVFSPCPYPPSPAPWKSDLGPLPPPGHQTWGPGPHC